MTILVTGATGTVGRHVVNKLVQKGESVRAVSRNPVKAKLPAEVEVVAGDLNIAATLKNAFEGVERLFLIVSSDEPNATLQTDPKVIKLAEKAGVKRVVVLVGYEEGPVEEALQNSSMEWTLLRPAEFMANILSDWRNSIRIDKVVREPFGEALSARIHEDDIAAVAVSSLLENGHHKKNYALTGPEALSRKEAVQIISKCIDEPIQFIELKEDEAVKNWRNQGLAEEDIEFLIFIGKSTPKEGYTVVPTVEQVTGRPAKSLADWVSEHKHEFL